MVRALMLSAAVVSAALTSGCSMLGGGGSRANAMPPATLTQIGVNSYLWRATLDTVSFAPLATTDSAGGTIVTDWYTNPADTSERVKISVAILDSTLRADALRVSAARQRNQNGQWVDAPVAAATVQRLEEIILTRARDLRRGAGARVR